MKLLQTWSRLVLSIPRTPLLAAWPVRFLWPAGVGSGAIGVELAAIIARAAPSNRDQARPFCGASAGIFGQAYAAVNIFRSIVLNYFLKASDRCFKPLMPWARKEMDAS